MKQMKKFILKAFLFILPFLFLSVFLEVKLKEVINSYNYKKKNFEKILSKCEVLILGNSISYCGIDPDILTYSAFNLANNSQDIYYDQMLYSKYMDRLPKLKYVIVPVAFTSLFYLLDQGIESWRASYYLRFFDIRKRQSRFDFKDISLIALYGINFSIHYLFNADATNQVLGISSKGWMNSPADFTFNESVMAIEGKRKYQEDVQFMDLNKINENLIYLNKIIEQSRKKNVITVLISFPMSRFYAGNLHEKKYYSLMQDKVIALSRNYGIKYYNYIYDKRFVDNDFSDVIHLNSMGAKKMSLILNRELMASK